MPLLIAHRGLLDGPDKDKENTISALIAARQQGYDVEIDVWYHDHSWWLGHDNPSEKIDFEWLCNIDQDTCIDTHHAWIHAKSIETLYQLQNMPWKGHVFFHENDPCVLTNTGYIWTYPGYQLTPLSICVMPEYTDTLLTCDNMDVFAFCTDYVHKIYDNLVNYRMRK